MRGAVTPPLGLLFAKALTQMVNSTMIEIDVGHDKSLMDRRAAPRRCLSERRLRRAVGRTGVTRAQAQTRADSAGGGSRLQR